MPVEMLTDQVVIGLGYGCTDNICQDGKDTERSVVWVGCMETCYVHVDFDNDGEDDKVELQQAYEGKHYTDTKFNDRDMSGTLIYATKGQAKDSGPVPIAAAWGQNAEYSGSGDNSAMDLGTVVVPFTSLRIKKFMRIYDDKDSNLAYSKGDIVEFAIEVTNVGQVDVEANTINIVDDEHVNWEYIEGTFVYEGEGGSTYPVADGHSASPNTPFPLDEGGLKNQAKITKRGGTHTLRFLASVPYSAEGDVVRNAGYMEQPLRPNMPFEVEEPLVAPTVWPRTSGGSCESHSRSFSTLLLCSRTPAAASKKTDPFL